VIVVPVLAPGLVWRWIFRLCSDLFEEEEPLEQHPEWRGKTASHAKEACERFVTRRWSGYFGEGNALHPGQTASRESRSRTCASPRAGGVGLRPGELGDMLQSITGDHRLPAKGPPADLIDSSPTAFSPKSPCMFGMCCRIPAESSAAIMSNDAEFR